MSFKKNKFLRYNNFISLNMAHCIYMYALMSSNKAKFLVDNKRDYYNDLEHGYFNDPQAVGVWSKYGDAFFDTILEVYRPKIEKLIDVELVSTTSYARVYENGSKLNAHTDNPWTEISATLCLGYDADNPWPFWIEPDRSFSLRPGDILLYRGPEVKHWRDTFTGVNHAQLFLHYNDKNSTVAPTNFNDSRPLLGLNETEKVDYGQDPEARFKK